MLGFWACIALFIAFCILFDYLTRDYVDPFQLVMVFGKKGSGKTTLLTRLALEHLSKGWDVYSTVPIRGCYEIKPSQVGVFRIPQNSVLLVDEVGMVWDNRDFRNFSNAVRDWFKLQRHYEVKCYLFSQAFDIDKKLRDLTDCMYLCEKRLRVFTWCRRINKHSVLTEAESDRPSSVAENLQFDSILFWPFGSRILTWIPKYAKHFDSFECPPLPDYPFRLWEEVLASGEDG